MEQVQLGDHVCVFVDGVDDVLDVLAGAVTAGLDGGDQVAVFAASLLPAAVWAGLEARGVPVDPARRAGQVRITPARVAFLPGGPFESRRVLAAWAADIDRAMAEGYPGLRFVSDMAWALDESVAVDLLADHEAEANRLYLDGRAAGMCLYDRRAFALDTLRQVACAHPASTALSGARTGWVPLLRVRRTADPYGLRMTGEADFGNRQALAVALDAVRDQQPDPAVPIVVDVAGLRFADAATAALLGRLALRAPSGINLVGCHGAVETVLDRLGVSRLAGLRLTRAATAGRPLSNVTELVA